MKVLIIAFVFILATVLPIVFIPLFFITVLVVSVVGPYLGIRTKWFGPKEKADHSPSH